jgi:hypothetical protein
VAEEDDDDLDLRPADAGALFRAEMATTNFLLGYWKGLLALLVVGLVSVLLYGKLLDYRTTQQKGVAGKVALLEAKLGAPLITLPDAIDAGQVKQDDVTSIAREMLEVSRESSGPGRVEAALKAAELFRIAGSDDERRAALEEAVPYAEGVLAFSAHGSLANLDLEQGNGDAAVARWQTLVETEDGILAEEAMLELGLVYEALGRPDDARKVYADFMARFPESSRFDKAQQRDARLAAGNG